MKCLCGCDSEVKKGKQYIRGHNNKGKIFGPRSEIIKKKISIAAKERLINKENCSFLRKKHSEESKRKMRESKKSYLKIPVDNNILCDYGCGKPAKYIVNSAKQKFCCSKYYNRCSFMILVNKEKSGKANREEFKCKTHSDLMKRKNPMFIEEHKIKVIKVTSSNEYKEKMSKISESFWCDDIYRKKNIQGRIKSGSKIPDEELTEFRKYYNIVYHYTRKSIKKYKNIINPENKPIGRERGLYNIDHIYSIFDGFINKVDPNIIGSYINLQVIPWIMNLKKQRNSWISKESLIRKYGGINEDI